jgi:hypothetical protein
MERLISLLKFFQLCLYTAFIFLWFKDHFPVLEKLRISYLVPLIPLLIVTLMRITSWIIRKKPKLSLRWSRDLTIIVLLILLAVSIRVPFLMHDSGILNSDDAIPLLQGKHMAEGESPAVYYYGQTRIGSLPFHLYALLFKLFGYSVFLGIMAYFFPFLGFIIIQYFFFKDIFSSQILAFILALFYCLPFRHLLAMSFYLGSNITFAFLLGSSAMYLSFLVYRDNKLTYIPAAGFLLGLAFWSYPLSIIFAICSGFFILLQAKHHLKHYGVLFLYFCVGLFPAIMFEFLSPDKTFNFIFTDGGLQGFSLEKMMTILKKMTVLISGEQNILNYFYLAIILSGIALEIFFWLKKRNFSAENIFIIYFLGFFLIYSFSHFPVDNTKLRYLYAFYFALPFLTISSLRWIRNKVKYMLMLCLFLFMILFSNIRDVHESYMFTKTAHNHLNQIIQTMLETGEKYWLGTFWDVHLLTALSGERITGWHYAQHGEKRYVPFAYMLSYFNQGENNNFVFFKQPGSFSVTFKEMLPLLEKNLDYAYRQYEHLLKIIDSLKINAEKRKIGNCWLIYRSESSLLPVIMRADVPKKIPDLSLAKTEIRDGWLFLHFIHRNDCDTSGFRITAEIEDFCSIDKSISQKTDEIIVRVPLPDRSGFELTCFLEYFGAKLGTTQKDREISLSQYKETFFPPKRNPPFVYLSGSIPGRQAGEKYLEKHAKIEINRKLKPGSKIRLQLAASLIYPEYLHYGDYTQGVTISLNGYPLTKNELYQGENLIEIVIPEMVTELDRSILELKFKYHIPLPHYPHKKTSAILTKIELIS